METITAFEDMLNSVEERMLMLVEKPSTRVQACQVTPLTPSSQLATILTLASHWSILLMLSSHWSAAGKIQGSEGGGGAVPAAGPRGRVQRGGGGEARHGAREI